MYYEPEGVFQMSFEEIFNEYDGKVSRDDEGSKPLDECEEFCGVSTCELPPIKGVSRLDGTPQTKYKRARRADDYRPRILWLVMYQWIEGAPMQIDAAPITGHWKLLEDGHAKQFALDELAIEWGVEENTEVLVEIVVAPDREAALQTDGEAEEMWVSV